MNKEDKTYYYDNKVYRKVIIPFGGACIRCAFSGMEGPDCSELMQSGIIDLCTDGDDGYNTTVYQRVEEAESIFLNII